jgi:hypothetical protein
VYFGGNRTLRWAFDITEIRRLTVRRSSPSLRPGAAAPSARCRPPSAAPEQVTVPEGPPTTRTVASELIPKFEGADTTTLPPTNLILRRQI